MWVEQTVDYSAGWRAGDSVRQSADYLVDWMAALWVLCLAEKRVGSSVKPMAVQRADAKAVL